MNKQQNPPDTSETRSSASLRFPPCGDFEANRLNQNHRTQPTSENGALPFSEVMALQEPEERVSFKEQVEASGGFCCLLMTWRNLDYFRCWTVGISSDLLPVGLGAFQV